MAGNCPGQETGWWGPGMWWWGSGMWWWGSFRVSKSGRHTRLCKIFHNLRKILAFECKTGGGGGAQVCGGGAQVSGGGAQVCGGGAQVCGGGVQVSGGGAQVCGGGAQTWARKF